ncbi:lipase member H-A-like [Achroia grisella]|uniref:lipase member H-A-like n=1 Tax=Achroia grisella TaxID=688607 RepID=UPI0027D2B426|nr:lipase member H-A-like [Achroia grisella]
MAAIGLLVLLAVAAVSALPADPIIRKYEETRYNYVRGPDGTPHLVDFWMKTSDLRDTAKYNPDRQNVYHLFTRENPTVSQPLVIGNPNLLQGSNYNAARRTVILIHGYGGSPLSNFNLALIPSYLAAADVNVVVVDWSRGAEASSTVWSAIFNLLSSGNVRDFIAFIYDNTDQPLSTINLVGDGLGALQAGIIGRRLRRQIGYITGLDPTYWSAVQELLPQLRRNDAQYTEVIHTNVGNLGYIKPMGQVDIYPNGGINMPGCGRDDLCDHERAYFYLAEALTSGGFTSRQCANYEEALLEECTGSATVNLGGVEPKTGVTGIYSVQTNASPPFSQG